MLLAGGNAIDAAIAALFALSVVEPMMVGIFGAGHMNLRLANGEQHVIDGYATAPAASRPRKMARATRCEASRGTSRAASPITSTSTPDAVVSTISSS